ncbi:MAG: AsmA family protein, partial [Terracidiphilus sp.]
MANSNLNRKEDYFDEPRPNLHEMPPRGNAPPPKRHRILRVVAWTAACLIALLVVCVVGVAGYINSNSGHRYILGLAQRKASEKLGVAVALQNYALHWTALGLDLYGIRVAGAAPHPNPPLFQADHVEVSVRVVSILHGKWHLQTVDIDHPVAWVVVDKNGNSNIPVIKSSGSSHTDIFDLGIRHMQITRGEVYYNSRHSSIAANLDGLEFKSVFNSLATRYSSDLSYSNGQLQFSNYHPLEHNLDASFDATRNQFTLKNLRVTAGASSVTLAATAKNYQTDPDVQAQYRIVLDGKQAAQLLNDPSLPAGVVTTAGTAQYRQVPQRSVMESLTIYGDLTSPKLVVRTASARLDASNLVAHYSLANGNAVLHDLRLYTLGGAVTAQGAMQQIGGNSHSRFQVAAQNLSLAQARQVLARNISTNGISIAGTANATATAEWGKTINDLIAHADLTLNRKAVRPGPPPPAREASVTRAQPNNTVIPLQGAVHAVYTNANGNLTLNNTQFQSPETQIRLNGTISRNSSLAVNLQANDLREVATFVDLIHPPQHGQPNLDLSGTASFQGSVRGSVKTPQLAGQFTAQNLVYNGTKWKALRAGIAASPSRASIENLQLDGGKTGRVTANAQVDLNHWTPSSHSPIQLDLNVAQITMDTLSALA